MPMNMILEGANEFFGHISKFLLGIGASRKEIMTMFLLKTAILGVFGSLVGGILSFAGGFIINSIILKDISYLFAPSSLLYIILGMGFGVFTGLLGGLYPAWIGVKTKAT